MDNKTRIIMAIVGSLLLFAIGMIRLLTESLTSTPLFVAYIFVITGFIGIIANGFALRKLESE